MGLSCCVDVLAVCGVCGVVLCSELRFVLCILVWVICVR